MKFPWTRTGRNRRNAMKAGQMELAVSSGGGRSSYPRSRADLSGDGGALVFTPSQGHDSGPSSADSGPSCGDGGSGGGGGVCD